MELKKLIQASDGIIKCHKDIDWQTEIQEIISDSRQVKPGSIFIALKGELFDGHKYIAQALQLGAEVVIIEDPDYCNNNTPWVLVDNCRKVMGQLLQFFMGQPSLKMSVIGVTGTNGKTSVTNMIAAIFEENHNKVGLIGTIHNRIDNEILPGTLTTPDSPELAKLFKQMVNSNVNYAIMEVSSHALAQNRVAGVEFDLAVFTNLTQDHLDFHGNFDEYLLQKSRLFTELNPQGKKKRKKMAILNIDDKSSQYLADLCRVPVITYGLSKDCLVRATEIQISEIGISYNLVYTNQVFPIRMKLQGQFNIYNSLAAIAVALVEGIAIQVIQKALNKMEAVPGRFQKVDTKTNFSVFVDYSHTPDSIKNCITTAKGFTTGRIITIFGAGGHRDRSKRPLMGEIAARLSDVCIVTSDNPRDEVPEEIIHDIMTGIKEPYAKAKVYVEVDRHKAIALAINMAQAGDSILICGKGHENYQIIGEEVLHFDDYEETIAIILDSQKST